MKKRKLEILFDNMVIVVIGIIVTLK